MEDGIDLSDDDVISVSNPDFGTGKTFKVSELMEKVRTFANQEARGGYVNPKVRWFSDSGVECEVLKPEGGGWQEGKVRFRLEFIPNNPPLQTLEQSPTAFDNL